MTDWEEKMKERIEFALKAKNYPRKIGGKNYYSYASLETKYSALDLISKIRKLGYNARTIRYSRRGFVSGGKIGYEIVVRRKE